MSFSLLFLVFLDRSQAIYFQIYSLGIISQHIPPNSKTGKFKRMRTRESRFSGYPDSTNFVNLYYETKQFYRSNTSVVRHKNIPRQLPRVLIQNADSFLTRLKLDAYSVCLFLIVFYNFCSLIRNVGLG